MREAVKVISANGSTGRNRNLKENIREIKLRKIKWNCCSKTSHGLSWGSGHIFLGYEKSHPQFLFAQCPQNANQEWDRASLIMHKQQLKLISMDGKFNFSFSSVHFLKLSRNYLLLISPVSCQAWQNSHPSPAVFWLLPYQVNPSYHPMVLLGHNCAG